ncbi:hypothetical protein RSAG8_02545, partial [Rhizoctonia solani AG-8 WAC10335]
MTGSPKYTPTLSRFPTDSSNDGDLDRILLTPPDRICPGTPSASSLSNGRVYRYTLLHIQPIRVSIQSWRVVAQRLEEHLDSHYQYVFSTCGTRQQVWLSFITILCSRSTGGIERGPRSTVTSRKSDGTRRITFLNLRLVGRYSYSVFPVHGRSCAHFQPYSTAIVVLKRA